MGARCSGTRRINLLIGSCQVTGAGTFAHIVSGSLARHRTHMMEPFLLRSIETGSDSCVLIILNLYTTARHWANFGARVHTCCRWSYHNAANLRQRFACSASSRRFLFGRGLRPALCHFFQYFATNDVFTFLAGIFVASYRR